MSGYIIHPYSADFIKTANLSYSIESIPIVAYGFIGITTLTLAYITFLESAIDISKSASEGMSSIVESTKSATSLLPSFYPPSQTSSPTPAQAPSEPATNPTRSSANTTTVRKTSRSIRG